MTFDRRRKLIITIVSFAIGYFIMKPFFSKLFEPDVNAEISKALVRMNKKLPRLLDKVTYADSISLTSDREVTSYMSLIGVDEKNVSVDMINNEIRPGIIKSVKDSESLMPLKEVGVTFIYDFYDMNKVLFLSITVTPEMYKDEDRSLIRFNTDK